MTLPFELRRSENGVSLREPRPPPTSPSDLLHDHERAQLLQRLRPDALHAIEVIHALKRGVRTRRDDRRIAGLNLLRPARGRARGDGDRWHLRLRRRRHLGRARERLRTDTEAV